jgi:hypothetical protein
MVAYQSVRFEESIDFSNLAATSELFVAGFLDQRNHQALGFEDVRLWVKPDARGDAAIRGMTGYGTGVAEVSQQANSDLSTCLRRRRHVDPNLGRRMEAPDYSRSI